MSKGGAWRTARLERHPEVRQGAGPGELRDLFEPWVALCEVRHTGMTLLNFMASLRVIWSHPDYSEENGLWVEMGRGGRIESGE